MAVLVERVSPSAWQSACRLYRTFTIPVRTTWHIACVT
jgi:hypothetical protein